MLNSSLLQKLPKQRLTAHPSSWVKPNKISRLSSSVAKDSILTNQLFNQFLQMVKEEMEEHEDFYQKERGRLGIKLEIK
jgi:hypothetical protein